MLDQHPSPPKRKSLRTRAVRIATAAGTCVLLAGATTALALTWGAPVDVAATGGNAYAQIAVAPDGAFTAVWSHDNGANNIVQAATRPAGGNWGAATDLSATGHNAGLAQIAVAPDGAATTVWKRFNGTHNIIQAATRPAGGNWGAATDLSATLQNADNPQIAVAPDGSATAVWTRSNGTNFIIQAATRPAGGSWGAATDLSATGGSAALPQIAVAPDGAATAVWSRSNGTNAIIQAASRPAGGSWGAATDLSATGRSAYTPQVAVASDGSTTAVWARYDGSNYIVQAATRPAGGSWGAVTDLSATGRSADVPQIAVAPDGSATAVWTRFNGTNEIIQAATRPAGGSWGAATDLSATGQDNYLPQVAVAPDGSATAVWRRDGTDYIIQAATRAAGGSWGAATRLSATGQFADNPQIALATDGTAAVVWDDFNYSGFIQAAVSAAPNAALTVATTGTGTGTVSSAPSGISCGATCSAFFALSSTVTLTATPASGSTFAGWSGDCSGASTTCTVTILGAASVAATFTAAGSTPSNGSSNGTSPAAPPSNASSNGSSPSTTPSNVLRIASANPGRASVITRISVPGPGTITQRGTYGASPMARELATRTACSVSRRVRAAGTVAVTCTLNAAARMARTKGPLLVRVATTFTPTGGTARTTTRTVTFRALRPTPAVTG